MVAHRKSAASQKHHSDPARAAYAFNGNTIKEMPVLVSRPAWLINAARRLLALGEQRSTWMTGRQVQEVLAKGVSTTEELKTRVREGWHSYDDAKARSVYWQEEIDWFIYAAFKLCDPNDAAVGPTEEFSTPPGSRPFEHHSGYNAGVSDRIKRASAPAPTTTASRPAHWDRRIALLTAENIQLLETSEFKRQWRDTELNVDQGEFRKTLERQWLESYLLDLLERHMKEQTMVRSLRSLVADLTLGSQAATMNAVLDVLAPNEDPVDLISRLVEAESIPYLSLYRYSPDGLDKHRHWKTTWELQRLEDLGQLPLDPDSKQPIKIPVPPRYDNADFRDAAFWRLRGKLDVPRERFISFPAAERADDTSRVIGWAGWDPVQRATALMNLFHERKAQEAWHSERLALLLRGVRELGFWLKLWHNQPSADFDGERPGDLFERLLDAEARVIGFTPEALDHIQLPDQKPPRPAPRRRGEAAS